MLPKQFLVPSLATLLLFNGLLTAEETAQEQTETSVSEHVPVRSREMDPAKRRQIQQRNSEESEGVEAAMRAEDQPTVQRASSQVDAFESPFMLAPCRMLPLQLTLASIPLPINCHFLVGIADNSRSVELEDGSHWEICPSDAYVLRGWRREDSIVITPNYNWFASYGYHITNKTANSYVRANMYVGPLAFGPYSHWIVDVDYFGGKVYLENQTVWSVSSQDMHILKDWAVNDHIIFGLYDSWFSHFDHILINVNMDDHLRVRQY